VKRERRRAALFDLDGTLTDPRVGITRSIRYALHVLGIDSPPDPELESMIGPPLLDSFRDRFGLGEERARSAVDLYREYFAESGLYENEVHPGIPGLLTELREREITLVLATSKPEIYARRILEHFGLASSFHAMVGSFLDGRRTDKTEVIGAALAQIGARTSEDALVMVGDRVHDVVGARANGIDVVAVGYGFGSDEELARACPTRRAATVPELRLQLFELLL
jgi:phosphoglycolate phosphatase